MPVLRKKKALDILLKAVAEVRKHVPNVRLILVGDGPLRGDLEKLAKDLAIEDITLFAGFQENVVEWLGKMRVFALTSVKEGMPYAVLEAAEAGRIIVATDVGAIKESISGEGFSALPCVNHGAMVQALVRGLAKVYYAPSYQVASSRAMRDATLAVYKNIVVI